MVVVLRRLSPGDPGAAQVLQQVLEGAPGYSRRITGADPGPGDGAAVLNTLPPGVDHQDKFVFAVVCDGDVVGCADLVRGWPDPTTAHLGLLVITDVHAGRGLGRAAVEELQALARTWPEITTLRLAVVATNAVVLPFWTRTGFDDTGQRHPYRQGDHVSESLILTKPLST